MFEFEDNKVTAIVDCGGMVRFGNHYNSVGIADVGNSVAVEILPIVDAYARCGNYTDKRSFMLYGKQHLYGVNGVELTFEPCKDYAFAEVTAVYENGEFVALLVGVFGKYNVYNADRSKRVSMNAKPKKVA